MWLHKCTHTRHTPYHIHAYTTCTHKQTQAVLAGKFMAIDALLTYGIEPSQSACCNYSFGNIGACRILHVDIQICSYSARCSSIMSGRSITCCAMIMHYVKSTLQQYIFIVHWCLLYHLNVAVGRVALQALRLCGLFWCSGLTIAPTFFIMRGFITWWICMQ